MENFLNFLQASFPFLFSYIYLFLFIGAAIEGLSTLVIGGFLVSTQSVSFLPALAAFALGHTVNGYIWYAVGYYGGAKSLDKWGRSKEKSRKIIETVEHYFRRHSGKAIFLTKFTFSLTLATQIMAGSLKYDLRKYSWYNFIGSVCWATFAMSIGYFFGASYRLLFVYLKDVAYFIVFLGGAIALIYILKAIFRSAFIKAIIEHESVRHYREKLRTGLDKFWPNGDGK
ncbi:MAG: DedA family protein [Candidatus Taylorbacteria bacterium]|nr:DedA family protein [Candidatus Taylorbacteria bacterium]